MEHYQHLILKALINGGGSQSESYVYRILTGTFNEQTSSVSDMWGYLDNPLKAMLAEILSDICRVNPRDHSDAEMVRELIEYMSKKAGNREFFTKYSDYEIRNMSEEYYDDKIEELVSAHRLALMNKEK